MPEITEFTIFGRPIGLAADHAYPRFEVKAGYTKDVYAKRESVLAKYQFTCEIVNVYSSGVYNDMLVLVPFSLLEHVTQGWSKSLHKAATNALPTQQAMHPNLVVIQNSWYGEGCHDARRCFQCKVAWWIFTHK